jgi:hypothetical protein
VTASGVEQESLNADGRVEISGCVKIEPTYCRVEEAGGVESERLVPYCRVEDAGRIGI